MNHTNNLIIEGNVSAIKDNGDVFIITLASERNYRNANGETVTYTSYFDIYNYGCLASSTKKEATIGRGMRIVGILKQENFTDEDGKTYSKVFIVSEHNEYKPKK